MEKRGRGRPRKQLSIKKEELKEEKSVLDFDEIGYYGTDIIGGLIQEEYKPELMDLEKRIAYYDEMMNDSSIATMVNLVNLPPKIAEYTVMPGSEDKKDVEAAEFVGDILYNRNGISTTYSYKENIIEENKNVIYGFMPFEIVYQKADWYGKNYTRKNMITIKKLASRHPKTIERWNINSVTGSLETVEQKKPIGDQQISADKILIPIEKMYIITNDKVGNNFEGVSILRPVVKNWAYKNGLYKIDAIGLQRNAMGLPVMKIANASPDKVAKALKIMRSAMVHEEPGIVLSKDREEFDYLQGGLHDVAIHRSIAHHDSKIYGLVLAGFLLLGQENRGGARALGMSLIDFFIMMSANMIDLRCDIRNRYLIPKLVDFNYTNIKRYPYEIGNISSMRDKEMFGNILDKLAKSMYVDPRNMSIRQYVHHMFGLPEPEEFTEIATAQAVSEPVKKSVQKSEPANKAEMAMSKWSDTLYNLSDVPVDYREDWINATNQVEFLQRTEISKQVSNLLKKGQIPNINYIDVPYNGILKGLMKEYFERYSYIQNKDYTYDFLIDLAINTHNQEMKYESIETLFNISQQKALV